MNTRLPTLTYARDLLEPDGSRRELARSAARGTVTRIARGAYVDSAVLASLAARERYLTIVRAVAETRGFRPVLSHWSAAAIHGLPILGA